MKTDNSQLLKTIKEKKIRFPSAWFPFNNASFNLGKKGHFGRIGENKDKEFSRKSGVMQSW